MEFDTINTELELLAAEQVETEAVLQYDEMVESWLYAAQERTHGPDRDEYQPEFSWEM